MDEVPGFPGYRITRAGKIVSLLGRQPRVLRPCNVGGYLRVSLRRDGRSVCRTVHSLMAEVYLGPKPPGTRVRHLDGDGLNNALTNLIYVPYGRVRRTHCVNGHPYRNNSLPPPKGHPNMRRCRTCHARRMARYRAKIRSSRPGRLRASCPPDRAFR